MTDPAFDAERCPKCGDVWVIRRIPPVAARARVVDLRICQCDLAHCPNPKCGKPVPFHTRGPCPHCNRT